MQLRSSRYVHLQTIKPLNRSRRNQKSMFVFVKKFTNKNSGDGISFVHEKWLNILYIVIHPRLEYF